MTLPVSPNTERNTVAAVQLPAFQVSGVEEFTAHLSTALLPAVDRGAQLVVLPGDVGLGLYCPGDGERPDPAACAEAFDAYLACGFTLARRWGIWLVPGSTLGPAANTTGVAMQAGVFAPDGSLIGRQQQTHRGEREIAWGLACGESLSPFATPFGPAGILIGEDVRYPEVSRILTLQGAEILLHLAATPAPFSEEAWLTDLWREVQGNQVFGMAAYQVGWRGDQSYQGRSAILAPVEMTEDGRGMLAQAATLDAGEVVLASLDQQARRQVVARYPLKHFLNTAWYARELLPAYDPERGGA
ncbi:MAG TPA: nitrilase-related carbon-nitrogen hydrolase [Armatimonadota bacterium]